MELLLAILLTAFGIYALQFITQKDNYRYRKNNFTIVREEKTKKPRKKITHKTQVKDKYSGYIESAWEEIEKKIVTNLSTHLVSTDQRNGSLYFSTHITMCVCAR